MPVLHVSDIELLEDTPFGVIVWQINSTDLDDDNVTFTITDQSEPGAFTIEGNVVNNVTFDFENTKNYSIEIR